jgi:hypothetical protein
MTTDPNPGIEHRREDGERVGWIMPEGEGFRPIDLLGRFVVDDVVEWLDAEEALEERGIGYLADRWMMPIDGGDERPVRIAEASVHGIVVVADEFGAASAIGGTPERFTLPFPVGDRLRPV